MRFIFLLFLMIPFLAFAQPKEGNILIGSSVHLGQTGNFGGLLSFNGIGLSIGKQTTKVSFSNDQETDLTILNINPNVGYTIIDGLVVGLSISYYFQKVGGNGFFQDAKFNSIAAGPLVRYYFDTKTVKPLLMTSLVFGSSKIEIDDFFGQADTKSNFFQLNTAAGIAYFANPHVALEALVGYQYNKELDENNDQETIFSGFGFTLGLSIYLGRKSSDEADYD